MELKIGVRETAYLAVHILESLEMSQSQKISSCQTAAFKCSSKENKAAGMCVRGGGEGSDLNILEDYFKYFCLYVAFLSCIVVAFKYHRIP